MINGKMFDFARPDLAEYTIEDVARVLAKKGRFGDHTEDFLSIAEHCCRAHDLYPRNRKGALMHDAPEFVMGDLITPLKVDCQTFKATEALVMADMEFRFEFKEPDALTFKLVDTILFHQEETFLYRKFNAEKVYDFNVPIECWSPEKAEAEFLDRFFS